MAKIVKKKASRRPRSAIIPGRRGKVNLAGDSIIKVIVVEDRGYIGYKGRQLVRVRYADPDSDPESSFEVAAEDLVLDKVRG
ncbi:MAG TPA: hypothetical protein VFC46_17545 [Humisphaera sp.]|nr:hypothetical protein [Humisphaera sp.]